MRADSDVRRDVEAELRWAPEVDETDIAVKVQDGIVALTGYARSYAERYRVEAVVKRVAGVHAVANDLAVRTPLGGIPTDPEIAREVVAALKAELPLDWQHLTVIVHEGHVGLEGTVEWHDQRERAEAAAHRAAGVLGVRNSISLKPKSVPADIKEKIEASFQRNALIDAQGISVEVQGSHVTLRGAVRSWAEREQARRATWSAPGVTVVRDELVVRS